MDAPGTETTAIDDFLDRYLRGDAPDAEEWLIAHAELGEAERRRIRILTASPTTAQEGTAEAADGSLAAARPASSS